MQTWPTPPQPFFDQPLMAVMKRLVTPHEQRGRLLRIESWPQQSQRLFGPVLWRTLRLNAQIKSFGGTNIRLVSSKRPASMRSSQIVKA